MLFDHPSISKPHPTMKGIQKIYKFPNGYGASVVRFKLPLMPEIFGGKTLREYGSYTSNEREWELAVIKFDKKGNWELTYDTPITNDVIGHLKKNDVEKILQKIKNLTIKK